MRYSISNAIPHNPKSKKHPYETLANIGVCGFFTFTKNALFFLEINIKFYI